ncbi:hypothetical protein FACS189434_13470 [Bacteroidia bacterium]|nr:hypothetical protein FACS189434_13470 [Bacteroidia bacterium]
MPELSAFHFLIGTCWLPMMPIIDYFFVKRNNIDCKYFGYIVQAIAISTISIILHFTIRKKRSKIIKNKPKLFNSHILSKIFVIMYVILSFSVFILLSFVAKNICG